MSVKKIKAARFVRKWHRRLGIIFGIQLMLWTLGGIYFSWFNIDNVHGDYERSFREPDSLKYIPDILPVTSFINNSKINKIKEIKIGRFLDKVVVRLISSEDNIKMFDAYSGDLLSPVSKEQAVQLAKKDFTLSKPVSSVSKVTKKKGEYKGPVPAYKISFDNSKNTNIYVSTNGGYVTARRNSIWRGFDFLWMFHIMDYQNRENFNNWILRFVSLFSLIVILSGYILWFIRKKNIKNIN